MFYARNVKVVKETLTSSTETQDKTDTFIGGR